MVPLTFANDPALIMQNWIAQGNTPEWLVLLEEAELRDSQTNGVIRCKQQALDSEEILSLVHSKFVTKLALEWEERLSFILNEDCSLKRLKFADQIREKNDDILKEDYAQRFDADRHFESTHRKSIARLRRRKRAVVIYRELTR